MDGERVSVEELCEICSSSSVDVESKTFAVEALFERAPVDTTGVRPRLTCSEEVEDVNRVLFRVSLRQEMCVPS